MGSRARVGGTPREVIEAYLGKEWRRGGRGFMSLLEVEHLSVAYGAIEAVRDVTMQVDQGEVVALIGANGAGKTTTLNALSGLIRSRAGRLSYDGRDLRRMRADQVVRAGLVQVPEGREVFARMTVAENLVVAGWRRRDRVEVGTDISKMLERFPILGDRRGQLAGQLSGGEQQIRAIARGLVARPRLLLLDEPSRDWRPSAWTRCSRSSPPSTSRAPPSCWWSRTPWGPSGIADRAYVMETGGRRRWVAPAPRLLADPDVRRLTWAFNGRALAGSSVPAPR